MASNATLNLAAELHNEVSSYQTAIYLTIGALTVRVEDDGIISIANFSRSVGSHLGADYWNSSRRRTGQERTFFLDVPLFTNKVCLPRSDVTAEFTAD